MKRILFLDLDGVLADFRGALPPMFDVPLGTMIKAHEDAMWAHINARDTFFRDLAPCPGALAFFQDVAALVPLRMAFTVSFDQRSPQRLSVANEPSTALVASRA